MGGHAASRTSLHAEESMVLVNEKSLSDSGSGAGRAALDSRFSNRWRIWLSTARAYAGGARSSSWRSMGLRVFTFLIPSFVQTHVCSLRGEARRESARLGPTSYLDGMRGLAALFVFFCHYFYTSYKIDDSWGRAGGNRHFLQLPFVRLFYQGPPMVSMFFVISGYALSLKPLRLARARQFNAFAATMSSFVFRRPLRLFCPVFISTFAIVSMARMGFWEWNREFAYDKRYIRNVQETHYEPAETAGEQFRAWEAAMFDFFHIWGWEPYGGSTAIDVHLWTIPVEFRSSMMLFLALVGTARLRTSLRFAILALLVWHAHESARWEMMLFYSGMALAELDLIRGAHSDPFTTAALPQPDSNAQPLLSPNSPLATKATGRQKRRRGAVWLTVSIVALYLMSQPDDGADETPGWITLISIIPEHWPEKYRYWQSLGAVLFVAAVGRVPGWQRVFNTGLVQYFGRISYAMYIVHGPVMHTVGYQAEKYAWRLTGIEGWRYDAGFLLGSLGAVPMVVWAADVFWRGVDAPVVRLSRWVEGRCSAD